MFYSKPIKTLFGEKTRIEYIESGPNLASIAKFGQALGRAVLVEGKVRLGQEEIYKVMPGLN